MLSLIRGFAAAGPPLLEQLRDLPAHRETPHRLLREQQLVAPGDLEDAAAAADHPRLDTEPLPQLRRQTGGSGLVASGGAELDADLGHDHPPAGIVAIRMPGPVHLAPPGRAPEEECLCSVAAIAGSLRQAANTGDCWMYLAHDGSPAKTSSRYDAASCIWPTLQ